MRSTPVVCVITVLQLPATEPDLELALNPRGIVSTRPVDTYHPYLSTRPVDTIPISVLDLSIPSVSHTRPVGACLSQYHTCRYHAYLSTRPVGTMSISVPDTGYHAYLSTRAVGTGHVSTPLRSLH